MNKALQQAILAQFIHLLEGLNHALLATSFTLRAAEGSASGFAGWQSHVPAVPSPLGLLQPLVLIRD